MGATNDGVRGHEQATDSAAKGAIFGRVVDAAGVPQAGAQVRLYRYGISKERFGDSPAVAETDGKGMYRFSDQPDGYFYVSIDKSGYARAFRDVSVKDQNELQFDVVLKRPVSPVIQLTDEAGHPVAGARVREFRQRGANGGLYFAQLWLERFGITILPSDQSGRLKLPPLPEGDVVSVTIDHPGNAPLKITDVAAAANTVVKGTFQPGMTLKLKIVAENPKDRIDSAVVDLRHQPYEHPSSMRICSVPFDDEGTGRLSIAPGIYQYLRLEHPDFYIVPAQRPSLGLEVPVRIEPGKNDDLRFEQRRKVSARGRVIDAATGSPIAKASLLGEIATGISQDDAEGSRDRWIYTEWTETDEKGEYTVSLAPGSARVTFYGERQIAEAEHSEFTVSTDGSTIIPDVRVRPVPKVVGIVKTPEGRPMPRAVVRLRGKFMLGIQPVLTDDAGRFELQPYTVPIDEKTERRVFEQHVVAFDPHRPLAGRASVRLDKPEEVVIRLEPHDADWPLTVFRNEEMSDWQRGIMTAEEAERVAGITLKGRPAPELDGALWLNTGERPLSFANLRGKFILLDFWFIGCGPCHGDFPSVKLVHELYKDHGIVVIGVHNNSNTPEGVRTHVAKIGLPFPVVVDHADGRIIAKYEEHGLPSGYPDYVLIGPDGNVLLDDRTIPHPALRLYKLEIIRKHILAAQSARK